MAADLECMSTLSHAQDAQSLSILLGIAVTFVTKLVVKNGADQKLKAVVAFILSALVGAVSTVTFDQGAKWTDYVFAIGFAFASNVATHYTGIADPVGNITPNFGLGGTDATNPQPEPVPADSTAGTNSAANYNITVNFANWPGSGATNTTNTVGVTRKKTPPKTS